MESTYVLHLPSELVDLRSPLTQDFIEVVSLLLSSVVSHFVMKSGIELEQRRIQ